MLYAGMAGMAWVSGQVRSGQVRSVDRSGQVSGQVRS